MKNASIRAHGKCLGGKERSGMYCFKLRHYPQLSCPGYGPVRFVTASGRLGLAGLALRVVFIAMIGSLLK